MINRKAHPFLRILPPFVAGLVTGDFLRKPPETVVYVCAILLVVLLGLQLRYTAWRMPFGKRKFYGILVQIFFFIFGFVLISRFPETNRPNHFGRYLTGQPVKLLGIVTGAPTHKQRTNAILQVRLLQADGPPVYVTGKLYASFPAGTTSLQYGQLIALYARPRPFGSPANPDAFDFGGYQYYHNVHYQCFVKDGQFKIAGHGHGNAVRRLALAWRQRFAGVLARVIRDKKDLSIALAMSLGIKDQLSPETKEAFAGTGSMHILAVSGLHVGIVSVGLRWLMLLLAGRAKARRLWRLAVQLAGVWLFVLLSGAGPAALRAGVMFSIIETGMVLDRRVNIFNSIAASAMFLLLWNPFLLFQAGFQLSYLALSGIVYFQPIFYKWLVFESSILDFFWKVLTVAMAAQWSTFPISIYYFHQFPVSFFVTGLVVVPAASVLLPATILMFLTDWIHPALADFLGIIVSTGYHWMSEVVFWVNKISFFNFSDWYFSLLTVTVCFGIILLSGYQLKFKYAKTGLWFLILFTILSAEKAYLSYRSSTQSKLVFFKLKKKCIAGFVAGHEIYLLNAGTPDSLQWKYATKEFYIKNGIKKEISLAGKTSPLPIGLMGEGRYWQFRNKKMVLNPQLRDTIWHPDIGWVRDTGEFAAGNSAPPAVVLSHLLPWKAANRIKKQLPAHTIHDMRAEGGFVIDISPENQDR